MSDLPSIQIVIVSPNGEERLGPVMVSKNGPFPQHDDINWDRERCAEQLPGFLRAKDGGGVEATIRAMDRLDCWRDCLERLVALPVPDTKLSEGLLWFWVSYGFHITDSLKGDAILVDLLRRFVPPSEGTATTLYLTCH